MQRILLLATWLIATPVLHRGAGIATAQVAAPGRPEPATGDTAILTLRQARRLALSNNPSILAEHRAVAIALGRLQQVRPIAMNPELEFRAPEAGSTGTIGEYEFTLRQPLELFGQRGLRIRAATAGVRQAEAGASDTSRRIMADVGDAFYFALAAQQRLGVVAELFGLSQQLVAITRIQAGEGEISQMDANLAEIEVGRAGARKLAAEREATAARLALQQLIGWAPARPIRLEADSTDFAVPSLASVDSLVSVALERRPDLRAEAETVAQQAQLTRLTRREAIPMPTVGAFVERQDRAARVVGGNLVRELESPRIGLGLTLPLPLFQRNQGAQAEQRARTEQAALRQQAKEIAIRIEVVDALHAFRSAVEEVAVFERDVLRPARATQSLLDTAFQAGKVALPTLLLLRNQLLDAELGYWEAWLAAHRAMVDLSSATAAFDTTLPEPSEP